MNASEVPLSLTGRDSHVLRREAGVGSVSIGPAGSGADLSVGEDEPIDWTVFDGMRVPAGYDWPRFVAYTGNDVSVFAWSRRRAIERLTYRPCRALRVDAATAQIGELTVHVTHALELVVPETRLTLAGELSRLSISGASPGMLTLAPRTLPSAAAPAVCIPDLVRMRGVEMLRVENAPRRQPVDARSLVGFSKLRHLALRGAVTGLDALSAFPDLETLELRHMTSLDGLPPLSTWPKLRSVIVWNVEKRAAAPIVKEARTMPKGVVSVSQSRDAKWFETEFAMPFHGWSASREREAVKAYKKAQKQIVAEATRESVARAIEGFVGHLNRLTRLETSEREDAAEAVSMLARASGGVVSEQDAQAWFDAVRRF